MKATARKVGLELNLRKIVTRRIGTLMQSRFNIAVNTFNYIRLPC